MALGNRMAPGMGAPAMAGPLAPPSPNPMAAGRALPAASASPAGADTAAPEPRGDQRADTSGPMGGIHAQLNRVSAAYDNGQRAQRVLDHVREELDGLMDMGDVVRPEDVVASAGRLVGKGIGAQQLAELLSSMPTVGGEGLASWVRMHDLTIRQAEANLGRENDLVRHRMGVAALRSLTANALEGKAQEHMNNARAIMSAAGPNAMAPGGGAMPPEGGGGGGLSMPTQVMQMSSPSPEDESMEASQ